MPGYCRKSVKNRIFASMKSLVPVISGFFLAFSGFALALGGTVWALQQILLPKIILSNYFWLLFIFLFFLTLIVYILSVLGIQKDGQTGVLSILGGIIIKFLLAAGLFLLILLKSNENQLVLGLNFFSIYLLFTVFEVIFLLRILRHQN